MTYLDSSTYVLNSHAFCFHLYKILLMINNERLIGMEKTCSFKDKTSFIFNSSANNFVKKSPNGREYKDSSLENKKCLFSTIPFAFQRRRPPKMWAFDVRTLFSYNIVVSPVCGATHKKCCTNPPKMLLNL